MAPNRTILKAPTVMAWTGLSRSHIYALAKRGQFPQPIKLSARSSGWCSLAVQSWIDSRVEPAHQA